jgi:hypothetical protein
MRWLLRGREATGGAEHFNPAVSRGNVGIYLGALNAVDQEHLEGALDAYQRMKQRTARTWGEGSMAASAGRVA